MQSELTLEKLKIHERLAKIEGKIDSINDFICKHELIINGNGNDGIVTKVSKLVNAEQNKQWHFRSIWVLMLGLVSKVVYDMVKNHG